MIYSWFSINLQNRKLMSSLSSSLSIRNGWTTGLREDIQHAVEKICYQLESQGFTNIADFSKMEDPYFVKDTIHLGWLGWLAFDKAVDPFLSIHASSDLPSE